MCNSLLRTLRDNDHVRVTTSSKKFPQIMRSARGDDIKGFHLMKFGKAEAAKAIGKAEAAKAISFH